MTETTPTGFEIRDLVHEDALPLSEAFARIGWNKPVEQFERYAAECETGERRALLALVDGEVAGYLTVKWESSYLHFRERNIPEIVDLNVLPRFRRRRIASTLMDEAESTIAKRSRVAGIGVGLYADYGAAQRMYVVRGYIPDGHGVFHDGTPVTPGGTTRVDDDLVLYFTKHLDRDPTNAVQ